VGFVTKSKETGRREGGRGGGREGGRGRTYVFLSEQLAGQAEDGGGLARSLFRGKRGKEHNV